MEEMGDVILIMVCPEACNPIENVARGGSPLPRLFRDHPSKYETTRRDQKRRTLEEVMRLINAYLPKDWALILVRLITSIPAILEEGFRGTRILTLNDNVERTTILTEWIREHEGAHFEYHWEKSASSDEEEEEEEETEEEEGEEQMMRTPDLEALLQPIEEETEQGIPLEKEVMVKTSERATLEGHAQELPIHASKNKEAMNKSAEHCKEQENVDERRDCIGWSFVLEKKKRKQMTDTVVKDVIEENPSAAHLEEPERGIVNPGVDSIWTSTMSRMKDSIRAGRITKKRRSQRKTTGTRTSTETIDVLVPPTHTFSPTTSTDLNEVWQLTLCTIKFYKYNIIH